MLGYNQILQILNDNADQQYNQFNVKIINSGVRTIGCRTPFLRNLAKQLKWEQVSHFPTHEFYEIDLLKGIVLSGNKAPYAEKSVLLREFAESIENWAVCDCSCVKVSNCEKEIYFDFFCNLVSDERPYVCRYGIVNLLSNYLDDEYIGRVFESFRKIVTWGEYYVDMAVAWLIATAMSKCRNATLSYMEGEAREILNVFTYNKALQKMRDSYRISAYDKQWTYALKRN